MQSKHSPNPEVIRSMFAKVAENYDRGNDVLSMGIHHLWRKKLVKYSETKTGDSVLDCATGTGDLAIEFKKAVGANGKVIGTDFCPEMLEPAPLKAQNKGLQVEFETADVTQLKYSDSSFDITSISFGIRNVGDPQKALQEMGRVTKSGGKVMILEFGQVNFPVFGALYNFYSQNILPKIGGLVTGQKEAYEYLQKSSAAFPCREEFLSMMKNSGVYSHCEYISLTGGIAYIYKGIVK